MGVPVGASDTHNGVTITADAIIGDAYSYAVVYSIAREDGQPLAEDLEPLGNGVLPLTFDRADTSVGVTGGSSHAPPISTTPTLQSPPSSTWRR